MNKEKSQPLPNNTNHDEGEFYKDNQTDNHTGKKCQLLISTCPSEKRSDSYPMAKSKIITRENSRGRKMNLAISEVKMHFEAKKY